MNAVLIRDFQNKIHTQQWTHARVRLQSYIAKNSLQTHTPCAAQTAAKEKKNTLAVRNISQGSRFCVRAA